MPRLLRVLAGHFGQLVNCSGFSAPLGMNRVTTREQFGILGNLFLVHTLSPWSANTLKHVMKLPKLHFLDAGLLAALKGLTPERLRLDRTSFGPVPETSCSGLTVEVSELGRRSVDRHALSPFRDKEHNEVDIVIERTGTDASLVLR